MTTLVPWTTYVLGPLTLAYMTASSRWGAVYIDTDDIEKTISIFFPDSAALSAAARHVPMLPHM